MSGEELKRILNIVRNLEEPPGYNREMIIIGAIAFSVSIKEQIFLGKKKIEKTFEPIGNLPEGVFFEEGYVPRVLVENGKTIAIEFLKKLEEDKGKSKKSSDPYKYDADWLGLL
ncbi:MAG: hypothetical protein ACFFCS_19100 [Candidatus Hodarchaeota archaeon]